jgi:hypothetical protein
MSDVVEGTFRPDALAEAAGISRSLLRKLRLEHLQDEVHYKKDARGLVYTQAGVEALRGLLDPEGAVLPDLEKNAAQRAEEGDGAEKIGEADGLRTLTVERLCPNPTWVRCRVDGAMVNVRVRPHRLRVGKKLYGCRLIGGTWIHTGRV